jgi:hypothetical protein
LCTNPRKGQAYTKAWLEEHCKLVTVEQENLVSYVKDIAQHISKLQETPDNSPCQVHLSGIWPFLPCGAA